MIEWHPALERPPPRTKAQPETAGLFCWARSYNAPMRTQVLLFYLAGALLAWSQGPPEKSPPRPGEAQSNRAQSKQSEDQGRAPKAKPTQPAPIQNSVESPDNKHSHGEPAPKDKQQATVDIPSVPRLSVQPVKDLADWGYWVFSGLLVVVGSLQAWLLYRGWQAAQRTAGATQDNAVATERNAKAAEENAAETRANAEAAKASADAALRQVALVERQVSLMEKSLQATQHSFTLSNRPKIVVRNIALDNEESILNFGSGHGWPAEGTGTARIVNVGATKAHLVAWSCHVLVLMVLPMTPPFDIKGEELLDFPIAPGEYVAVHFPTTRAEPLTVENQIAIQGGRFGLYVLGRAVYKDDLGTVRATSFCREWKRGYERFKPVDNPDYENAD